MHFLPWPNSPGTEKVTVTHFTFLTVKLFLSNWDFVMEKSVILHKGNISYSSPVRGLIGTPPRQYMASFYGLRQWLEGKSAVVCPPVFIFIPPLSPCFKRNTLSSRTKESHVRQLFRTAVAMTGNALKCLLSEACGKGKEPNWQILLEVSKSAR